MSHAMPAVVAPTRTVCGEALGDVQRAARPAGQHDELDGRGEALGADRPPREADLVVTDLADAHGPPATRRRRRVPCAPGATSTSAWSTIQLATRAVGDELPQFLDVEFGLHGPGHA